VKKIYYIVAGFLALAGIILLVNHHKNKCQYPVFDLNFQGQAVEACFQATSIINHEHKDTIMIEVVSPSAQALGENLYFEDKREMALFACQILFQSLKKQPTLFEITAANKLPHQKVIKAQNHSLFVSVSEPSSIIDRLFCMTGK
jgi:hypothetical protein